MFRIEVPVQTRIMAVYMPIIEFCMLLQFWFFWNNNNHNISVNNNNNKKEITAVNSSTPSSFQNKYIIAAVCFVFWSVVILTQVFSYDSSPYFAWAAIGLWSVETFPQLWTNLATPKNAVLGQSVISILITVLGKTTDSLSAYLLDMPLQTRVLAYFSGTSAWLNAFYILVVFSSTQYSSFLSSSSPKSAVVENDDESVNDGERKPLVGVSHHDHDEEKQQEQQKIGVPTSITPTQKSCFGCAEIAESGIRYKLASSKALRTFVGCILVTLMIAVVTSCFLTIEKKWIVVIMISTTVIIVGSFHVAVGNRKKKGGDNGDGGDDDDDENNNESGFKSC